MYDDIIACGSVGLSDAAANSCQYIAAGAKQRISDEVVDAVYRDVCGFSTANSEIEKLRIRRVLEAAIPRILPRAS